MNQVLKFFFFNISQYYNFNIILLSHKLSLLRYESFLKEKFYDFYI